MAMDTWQPGVSGHMRDAKGFDEFYRGTSMRLLRFGYAVVGDLTETQDLVQEAYIRAWRDWRSLAGHPNPEGWLRLVLTRLAADRWRRISRRNAALLRNGPPEPIRPPNEDRVLLVAALRQLPLAQRHALALHYVFDLPVAEIAKETRVPEGTVKSWLSRGRDGLAAILTGSPSTADRRRTTDDRR